MSFGKLTEALRPTAQMEETPQLFYASTPLAWYQRRRVQRWLVLLAVGIVLFTIYRLLRPMWERYRYYRSEQAMAATWVPPGVAVQFSTTMPFAPVPGPVEIRDASFWATRSSLPGLATFTIGAPHTEIFSGVLRTSTGRRRLVQVYASNVIAGRGIALVAVTVEPRDWHWVIHGGDSTFRGDGTWFGALDITPKKFSDVTVFGGTPSPTDPSEVDVKIIMNGQTYNIPLHVVEVHPPDGFVAMASPFGVLRREDGSVGSSFVEWPYTPKP